jgi:hypothetical protein
MPDQPGAIFTAEQQVPALPAHELGGVTAGLAHARVHVAR